MKAKVLSLNVDKSMSFARFQARIGSSLKPYVDNNVQIEQFEDIREMFVALQSALENDGLVITAVDNRNFLRFKSALIQAFGTEVTYNPSVLNKIEGLDIDDKKKKMLSAFPEPATVFLSDDGVYSGFGMENGEQYLMLLPIDNNRIDSILRDGVVPFLSKSITVNSDYSHYYEEKSVNNQKVAEAVKKLVESGSMVAVNGTKNAEVIKSCGDSIQDFNNVFVFTPHVEDKGNVNVTEYTAQLAKVSLDLSAANLGACISDIYMANNVKYICIAVASDESAVVRKLYMSENETEDAFVESAAVELIELIGEKAVGKRSVGIEIADTSRSNENLITEEDKKPAGKKPLAILAIVLGVAIVVCAVIAIVFSTQGGFSFGEKETTTEPTTDLTTTEPTTQASQPQIIDKTMAKFSDFMVAKILSMTNDEIAQNCVITDTQAPQFITVNGEQIEAKEALARLVTAELGSGYREDAIKAQTVAIYTCLKFLNNDFVIDGVQITDTYNTVIKRSVDAVFGEYLTYNGALALTPYHNASPTQTLDMTAVLPYLKAVKVDGNPDVALNDYQTRKEYKADVIKTLLLNYDSSFVLSENPKDWVVVKSHDSAISDEIGNVTSVTVGGKEFSGFDFRMNVIGIDKLASICFTVEYNEETGKFIVTTYGKGFSVGMSQTGANFLAVKGDDYVKILTTYYEGTTIAKEEIV